jgi:ribonuclease HI
LNKSINQSINEPWRAPPRVEIREQEEATRVHDSISQQSNPPVRIYTDGSGYMGYVGAAMVIPEKNRQLSECLGTEATSTVYAGESRGIELALRAVLYYYGLNENKWQHIVIFTDSQAALKTLCNPRMVSGQSFIQQSLNLLVECEQEGIDVRFYWIPSHEGIAGNEAADRAAKRAALMGAHRQVVPGDLHDGHWTWLASAARRRVRQSIKDAWKQAWDKEKAGKPTRKLISAPSKKVMRYWGGLRKATSSILIQLRTERVALNQYLWRINRRESPRCPCDLSSQTVRHILTECQLYVEQRQTMWDRIRGLRRTTEAVMVIFITLA